jgi:hypothetical protein
VCEEEPRVRQVVSTVVESEAGNGLACSGNWEERMNWAFGNGGLI